MGNLQQPNGTDVTLTKNRSRDVAPQSGLCSRCVDGCIGNCEVFKATFRGRELIYPGPFGDVTAGGDKDYPVDYSHLNIHGYALGGEGLPEGVEANPDTCRFPGCQHGDCLWVGQEGQAGHALLHGSPRFDRNRPEELGTLRRRRRPVGRDAGLWRERLRHRSRAWNATATGW
jgi:hypothetical protein